MQEELRQALELFVENRDSVKSAFKWESEYMYPLCGLLYSGIGEKADVAGMKEADEILKKSAGWASEFRGIVRMALITQMALAEDKKAYFEHVKSVYEILNRKKIFGSEYRVVTAMIIAGRDGEEMTDEQCVERTNEIFARMEKNHPWLTDDHDRGFAALLAISGLEIDSVIAEMEECYKALKATKKFTSADGLQSLSHILALQTGNADEKCGRVLALYDGLKEKKKKYGCSYELCTLGGLALTDAETETLVEEVAQADEFLKTQKGFDFWGVGNDQRLMYAAILELQTIAPKKLKIENAALNSVISLVIAQEVAMMAAITTTIIVSSSN